MNQDIVVEQLYKNYEYFEGASGFRGLARNFIKRDIKIKNAVKNLSFTMNKGEMVGFIGKNGSGKTTTMKMLTGILTPTSGRILIGGNIPIKRSDDFKKKIGLVMGQKSQLWWDLPAKESFDLNRIIYEINKDEYQKNLNKLVEILGVKSVLNIPVRKLSLGERMKLELIASLIHGPEYIFLDEPTIGLDVCAQFDLREFIKEMNKERNITVLITSHNMKDIEDLCKRSIILSNGELVFDGDTSNILDIYPYQQVNIQFEEITDLALLMCYGEIKIKSNTEINIKIEKNKFSNFLSILLNNHKVNNFYLEPLDIEACVRYYYFKDQDEHG